ncbi:MAG: carboxypeptidase regulatory-like domain-containing protein, partial [Acidobacteria bacterium]|nr:carboxypeptidase regulatory-like domain-containing protein [Acidobacteriota bacterium]
MQGLKTIFPALAILVASFFPSALSAQTVGATLSGTITDPSGSVIPNAQVAIVNNGTGAVTNVTSNGEGFYSAPNLQPGDYVVRTTASGFAGSESHITLAVGAQQLVN